MRPNVKCEGDLAVLPINENIQVSITAYGGYLYEDDRLVAVITKSQLKHILGTIEEYESKCN